VALKGNKGTGTGSFWASRPVHYPETLYRRTEHPEPPAEEAKLDKQYFSKPCDPVTGTIQNKGYTLSDIDYS